MGAVSERLVAKSVVSLELSLEFSLPESSVYSTLRRKDDSVLATGLLWACSVATEVISPRPGQGALQASSSLWEGMPPASPGATFLF